MTARLTERLIVVSLLVLAVLAYGREQRRRGGAEARVAVLAAERDSLAARAARVDTVYARDTLTLWRQVRSTDTLTQTVEAWKHDTVRVVEYVQRADSTIRACVATVLTCETRVAQRDSIIRNWESTWAARPKPPSPLATWGERLGWLALVLWVAK